MEDRMERADPGNVLRYGGATGKTCYDSIRFSGPPKAELLSASSSTITVVRHIAVNVEGESRARAVMKRDDYDLLAMNLNGSGQYDRFEGGKWVRAPLRRDDISFIPHGYESIVECPPEQAALLISFPSSLLGSAAAEMGTTELEPIHTEPNARLAQLVRFLVGEVRTPGFAADVMLDGIVRAIAATMIRQDAAHRVAEADRIYLTPLRLNRVIEFIEANLSRDIALTDLARVAGLSIFHFARVFKRATGQTPYQFVCHRRLSEACRMLAAGEVPLAQLALSCGFSSQAHFTAAFSKAMGMPPGRYRRVVLS
jgi:AraC-like DNA-binding protein